MIALLLFAANQLTGQLVLAWLGHSYTDLCVWDCQWYLTIVRNGYDLAPWGHDKGDAADWVFFPAMPLAASLVAKLGGISSEIALIVTGRIFFLCSIFAFIKLSRGYNPKVPAALAGSLVAFSPYAVYAEVGYTEPLFLLLTCLSLYFMFRGKFVASGLAGGLLSATRFVGLAILCSYLVCAARAWIRPKSGERARLVFGALLIPLGLALFMVYLYFLTGDALAFSHVQRAWGRTFHNPLRVIAGALLHEPLLRWFALMDLLGLALCFILWIQKRHELAVFSLVCIALAVVTGLYSAPRYLWWQAPMLLVASQLLARLGAKKYWLLVFPALVAGFVVMLVSWFSGRGFVV